MRDRWKERLVVTSLLLVSSILGLLLLEFVGRTLILDRERLYFVYDVAHRRKATDPESNADGIRSRVEADAFRSEDLNFIFLGDSFIAGGGLTYDETIPSQFQRMALAEHPGRRINVANFGWVSSSPLLSLDLLRDIGARYRPDVVILHVDMTDFHDDLKYQKLIDREGVFKLLGVVPITVWIVRKVVSMIPGLEALHRAVFGFPTDPFFATASPLSETRPLLSPLRRNIDGIHRYATEELAARFLVVVFPRSYQYSDREAPNSWERDRYENLGPHVLEPFRWFESIAKETPYPIFSLLEDFQQTDVFPTCFDDDPHWNADGAGIAASAILRICQAEGCFDAG